jgi:hypothetical protein
MEGCSDTGQGVPKLPDGKLVLAVWPRLLTMQMTAAYLGLSIETLKKRGRELPGRKCWGKRVVYDRVELDRMIDHSRPSCSLWLEAGRRVR